MNLFKKMKEWEKDLPGEFVGTKRNVENTEKAAQLIEYAKLICEKIDGASFRSCPLDNPYFPDHSTVLKLPNYTNIISSEISGNIAKLFDLADIVQMEFGKADNQLRFVFTVRNVWAE